jgi:hypothetical protein
MSLDPWVTEVTDYFGNPVPPLRFHVGPDERKALEDAKAIARRIVETLGLTDIRSSSLTFAAHQMGTRRMGPDPRTSVVDPPLRAHDVPNLYLVSSSDLSRPAPPPDPDHRSPSRSRRPSTSRLACARLARPSGEPCEGKQRSRCRENDLVTCCEGSALAATVLRRHSAA